MNILLTGGSGFVGSNLINQLRSNPKYQILNIDKKGSIWHKDITNIIDINDNKIDEIKFNPDTIIHLAAEHRDDVNPKSLYYDVNVNGTKNIINLAKSRNTKSIIFFSSVAVYGFAKKGTNESGDINPFNEYGSTKWLAEIELKKWHNEDPTNRKLVIIRPTVIFGPRNRGNFYNLINQIASSRFLKIGSGKNFKSLAYIDNVVDFVSSTINFKSGYHCYNYVDKPDMDMNQVISTIYKALGKKEPIMKIPYSLGLIMAKMVDFISMISGKKFSISSVRIKKFCSDTSFESSIEKTGYIRQKELQEAIIHTVNYEFNNIDKDNVVFYTE